MHYKLLAPVRTAFSIRSETPIRDPDGYRTFWDAAAGVEMKENLRRRLPAALELSEELHEIRFAHASPYHKSRYNRYTSLRSDSLERPLHVFELELDGHLLFESSSIEIPGQYQAGTVLWRIFDHGVGLLEVNIAPGETFAGLSTGRRIRETLDGLQQTGIRLTRALARWTTEEVLEPIFEELRSLEDSDQYLELPSLPRNNDAGGAVLWVTRSLIFDAADTAEAVNRETIVREWLRDTVELSEENGNKQVDHIINDSEAHLTKWLNYLFREESYEPESAVLDPPASARSSTGGPIPLARPFCDVWEAMLYAQFFYGALDLVDGRLTSILAESLAQEPTLRVHELKSRLERSINRANLLLLQRHESAKYFKRTVASKLEEILDDWDFDSVLVEPVERKIDICQERLALLHQKEVARSGIYTDLILISIGITSIFGMSLAVAEYGRTMANDPDLASYDVTSAYIIDWFAALPTDIILTWAGILSLALVGIYFYYRRRQIN